MCFAGNPPLQSAVQLLFLRRVRNLITAPHFPECQVFDGGAVGAGLPVGVAGQFIFGNLQTR